MPVNLATQETEIRRITVQSQPGQIVCQISSGKILHKKNRAGGWLKVKALSSRPSTTKKKKKLGLVLNFKDLQSKQIINKNTKREGGTQKFNSERTSCS
jgi:hypothetical protein